MEATVWAFGETTCGKPGRTGSRVSRALSLNFSHQSLIWRYHGTEEWYGQRRIAILQRSQETKESSTAHAPTSPERNAKRRHPCTPLRNEKSGAISPWKRQQSRQGLDRLSFLFPSRRESGYYHLSQARVWITQPSSSPDAAKETPK